MRSLQADRGISSLVGLGLGVALLLLWVAWFFFAPITRYETGILIGLTKEGRVVAEFPAHTIEHIWQGQAAHIRLQPAEVGREADGAEQRVLLPPQKQMRSIPAIVANILGPTGSEHFQISFAIQGDALSRAAIEEEFVGTAELEVEIVSPAMLVARASGQFVDTPSLSLSPQ